MKEPSTLKLKYQTKFDIDDTITVNNIQCTISAIDAFGLTSHYGIWFKMPNNDYFTGWIPTAIVDNQ